MLRRPSISGHWYLKLSSFDFRYSVHHLVLLSFSPDKLVYFVFIPTLIQFKSLFYLSWTPLQLSPSPIPALIIWISLSALISSNSHSPSPSVLRASNRCINFMGFFSKLGCRRCWHENNMLSGSGDEAMFLLVFVFVGLWASWLVQRGKWINPFNFGCDLSQNLSFFERGSDPCRMKGFFLPSGSMKKNL